MNSTAPAYASLYRLDIKVQTLLFKRYSIVRLYTSSRESENMIRISKRTFTYYILNSNTKVSWEMVFALVYGQHDQLDFTSPAHLSEKLHIQETLNMNLKSVVPKDRVLDLKGYVAYLS